MKKIVAMSIALLLLGCAPRMQILPNSPGEVAAQYSAQLRIYTAVADQAFKTNALSDDVALQVVDALQSANDALRVYYAMSTCKNVKLQAESAEANAKLLAEAVNAACAQFEGKPLDDLAQLKLAQAALAALSQQLRPRAP